MTWQDEHCLHQGKKKDDDQDVGNTPEKLPCGARHKIKRNERGNSGKDGDQYRRTYFPCSFHGSHDRRFVHLLMGIDILANHNGIINHDSKNQDEGEEGYHVDAHIDPWHGDHGPGITDRNPHHDPEGKRNFEEKSQCQKYQNEPVKQILDQQVNPVLKHCGTIVEDRSTDANRQSVFYFQKFFLHRLRDFCRSLVPDTIDRNTLGRFPVITVTQNGFLKSIRNPSNVPQQQCSLAGFQ